MKKRISDLLDDCYPENIEISETSPLSTQRIKKITMDRIPREKPVVKRRPLRFFLIAALIAVLVTTAVAVDDPILAGSWFMRFFSKQEVYAQITREQLLALENATVEVNQSVTCDGYTITLERVISDGYCTFLQFHITAPEGVMVSRYNCFEYDTATVSDAFLPDRYDDVPKGTGMSLNHVYPRDENPNDNQGSVVVWIADDYGDPVESGRIMITGIISPVGDPSNWETIAQGQWEFCFDLPTEFAQVEMLSEPVIYFGWDDFSRKWHAAEITSFSLRTLTAQGTVKHKKPWGEEIYYLTGIKIVMKNGTVIEGKGGGSVNSEKEAYFEFYFDEPISFADVAYVEFPGGAKALMPQQ